MTTNEERNWCVGVHLASFAGILGLAFGSIIGPLIVWLIKRHESPLVDAHGKEALNFQISMSIWTLCCIPFFFLIGFGLILVIILLIIGLINVVLAAIAANEGRFHNYPLKIQFLK